MVDRLFEKIRKMRTMSHPEIRHRIQSIIFERIDSIRYRLHRRGAPDRGVLRKNPAMAPGGRRKRSPDRFFTEAWEREKRREVMRTRFDCASWIAAADRVLSGRVAFLGREAAIPRAGGWQTDPLTGNPWPRVFHARVKTDPTVHSLDVKYVWELNRHQFLILLGKAYWLTGDERYAGKMTAVIRDWIADNPVDQGVNWTSSLELAVRAISWIWACRLCQGSAHLDSGFQDVFWSSIREQARYMARHLSFYSSPYNHLIGEAGALHLIGSLFPEERAGRGWEDLGWAILCDWIDRQFHEDGMSVEQATFYHHFTLGFYLQAIFLRRLNGKPVPATLLSRIEKALEFALHITRPDGTLPMIGDIDNARSLYFSSDHSWDFRGFLGMGAVLLNRPDFRHQCPDLPEELAWLGTDGDLALFGSIAPAVPTQSSVPFYRSGYFISRNGWRNDADWLCFDCGEIAGGLHPDAVPSAAHGHADALSFELAVKGRPFIIDSGFHTYFGDLEWHAHFRHEEAHNTVRAGELRQAEYCGRLKWRNVGKPRLHRWESTDLYDTVCGSISYAGDVRHTREMTWLKHGFFLVRDRIDAKIHNFGEIRSCLHFSPEVDLSVNPEPPELLARGPHAGLSLFCFGGGKITVQKGGDDPAGGWIAPGYGMKQPAWRVMISWEKAREWRFFPLLMVPLAAKPETVRATALFGSQENTRPSEIRVETGGIQWEVTFGAEKTAMTVGADGIRRLFLPPTP